MPSSAWSSDVCSSDRSEEHTSELQSLRHAPWYSEEHACLSVIKFSTPIDLFRSRSLDSGVCWHLSAPLKCISGIVTPDISVIIVLRCRPRYESPLIMVFGQTSHQI